MTLLTTIVICLGFHGALGLFLHNSPCDLVPHIPGSGIPSSSATVHMDVPSQCRNGSFYWDYPSGHVVLHFTNVNQMEMKICFGDDLGGNVFGIVELSTNYKLPSFERNSETRVCTHATSSKDIELRVDAPEMLYYMGAMVYNIQS